MKKSLVYLGLLLGGALVLFFFNYTLLTTYIHTYVPSGNDSSGHVAIGEYYAKHIFPATWGWAGKWFAGMPFPQFYPPLFYFLAALVYTILPISYAMAFKVCVLSLSLAIPGILSLIMYKYSKSIWGAILTNLSSAILLSIFYPKYGNLGVTLQSTFHVGLDTHLLGFVCLILWMYFFFNAHYSRRDYNLSIFFLAATFLSSVHVVPVAFVIYCVTLIVDKNNRLNRKRLWQTFLLGALPLALSLFWYLPMLAFYKEIAGRSLGIDSGIGAPDMALYFERWWYLFVCTIGAAVLAYRRKHTVFLSISVSALFLFVPVGLHLDRLIPRLPVHIYRILPCFYMLSAISAGYCLARLLMYLRATWLRVSFTAIFCAIFIIAWIPYKANSNLSNFYLNYNKDKTPAIANYLKNKTGTLNVEVTAGGRPLEYVISSVAGPNLKSDYNILVESSIQSPFMVPFRGAFSTSDERMSVDAFMRSNPVFRNQDSGFDTARARMLGVNYFLVATEAMKSELAENPNMSLEKSFGRWDLYHLNDQVTSVKVLQYEPTVVFAPADFKKRTTATFDFVRFQEELFLRADEDMVLAHANTPYLDTAPELDRFQSAIITDYTYHDLAKAEARLVQYAKNHSLVLIENKDNPLYVKLKKDLESKDGTVSESEHVLFVSKPSVKNSDQVPVRNAMTTIFEFLKAHEKKITLSPTITYFNMNDQKISLAFASSSPQEVPVLIKSTYFPAWKRTDGEASYMATPVYTLTYVKEKATLIFIKPPSLIIGYIISLLALIYILRSRT